MDRQAWKKFHRAFRCKHVDIPTAIFAMIDGTPKSGFRRWGRWNFEEAMLHAMVNKPARMLPLNRRKALQMIRSNRAPSKLRGI